MSAVNFIVTDAAGNFIRSGFCPADMKDIQAQGSELALLAENIDEARETETNPTLLSTVKARPENLE